MPQTSVVFSSILGPNCNRQVQPGMGERGGGASNGSRDLIFQDGRLTSGSLEALMEHLVPTVDYYPDVSASRKAASGRRGRPRRGCRVGWSSRASAASWVFITYSAVKVLSSRSCSDSPAAPKQGKIREDV